MKAKKPLLPVLVLITFFAMQCKKGENSCTGVLSPKADFAFKEVLSDTAFYADTVFSDNTVNFCALRAYTSVLWKIGNDPRDFTSAGFNLNFPTSLGSMDVTFTGKHEANPLCFPGDNGIDEGVKKLTVVEQVDKATLTVSPLVGHYRGSFDASPHDLFTVRINYFDSAKYNTSITGSKNFYWISNIPKGYVDSTSSRALAYPELRNGMSPEMGYKCLAFGDLASSVLGKGYGQLTGDTLKIYYNNLLTGRKLFTGRRI